MRPDKPAFHPECGTASHVCASAEGISPYLLQLSLIVQRISFTYNIFLFDLRQERFWGCRATELCVLDIRFLLFGWNFYSAHFPL